MSSKPNMPEKVLKETEKKYKMPEKIKSPVTKAKAINSHNYAQKGMVRDNKAKESDPKTKFVEGKPKT